MRKWLGMGAGAVLLTAAIAVWASAEDDAPLPPAPPEAVASNTAPLVAPEAAPADREAKRLARYDKDDDGAVSRDEYLTARRKAFAKLDVNGDGRLGFDEYAVKTTAKFDTADADDTGVLTAEEFATTAVTRKPKKPCPPERDA